MEPSLAPADPSRIVVVGTKGRRVLDAAKANVQPRDFRSPALLSDADLRRLRAQQGEFARHFAAKVSASLRLEFTLNLSGVTTLPYTRFTAALPDPACLTLFKMEPAAGLGVISLPPPLALAITNRMLGGRGEDNAEPRALTEIEISLLEDFVRTFAEDWCRQWPEGRDAPPLLIGYETNGKFLQTSPENTTVLVITLEASLGQRAQTIQIALPFAALTASLKRTPGTAAPREPRPAAPPPDKAVLARRAVTALVTLPVVAAWVVAALPLRDLLGLRASDVLELPAETLSQTRLSFTGRPMFVGAAGVRDGRVAVQLDRRLADGPAGGESSANAQFLSLLAQ